AQARRDHVAEDHVLDVRGVDAAALQRCADRDRTELGCLETRKSAEKAADRRARRSHDHGRALRIRHTYALLLLLFAFCGLAPRATGRGTASDYRETWWSGPAEFSFFLHCGRGGGWRARARRVALAALAGGGTAGHGGEGMPDLGSLILFPTRYSCASLWLRPCRSALRLLDQRQLSVLLADPPPCDRRVVLEDQEPVLLLRALHDRALRFQRYERLDVIAHDPRERQVRTGGHDVRKKDGGLAGGLDEDGLVMRGVARRAQHGNAGDDLDVP